MNISKKNKRFFLKIMTSIFLFNFIKINTLFALQFRSKDIMLIKGWILKKTDLQ
jgi:hypothetical protein